MELKKLKKGNYNFLSALVIVIITTCVSVAAQELDFIPDRAIAENAFNNEDYITALKHYKALSANFSADPLYKYLAGVCMVELKKDPGNAKIILKEAIDGSSALRQVPDKAWYYMGKAYQFSGDFVQAIDAYDIYKESARRKDIKELGIDALIDQCNSGVGAIQDEKPAGQEEIEPEGDIVLQEKEYTEFLKPDSDKINIPDITVEEKVKEQGPGDEYKMQAREALEYQFRADSLHRLANRYRITLDKLSGSDRQSVKNKILALEQEAFDNQRIADSKYRKAADISSMEYDERPVFETRDVKQYKPDEVVEGETDTTVFVSDTIKKNVPEEEPRPYVPVLEIFSDNDDQSGPIPVNNALPEGLIYRIQLAALRNPKEISFFKGLGPVSIYRAEGSNINFYYTGIFRLKKDAERALVKVQQKGFKDAFILAQLNGSRVSMEKAGQLEEQWSEVSLYDREVASDVKPAEQQEPPTLVYRVQVLKVKEKVDDDELDLIERLANKRSYDILKTVGSEYVYLIGKFITFESAAAYADLLYKNGMKEAKVVAYLGRKEIPLETAKKLFDLYFDKL